MAKAGRKRPTMYSRLPQTQKGFRLTDELISGLEYELEKANEKRYMVRLPQMTMSEFVERALRDYMARHSEISNDWAEPERLYRRYVGKGKNGL